MTSYESLRSELLASGDPYEDPDFPASEQSLGFGNDQFVWRRPKEICELIDPNLQPELFVQGRDKCDVRQGKLIGNCWVVAAAACFSTAKQEVFDHVVPPDQGFSPDLYCGAFQFNFWVFGKWKNVIVDDRLPTIDDRLAFIHSTSPNEFWGALLEKAYAKLYGKYKLLEVGHAADALIDFTGGLVEHYILESHDNCCTVCNLLQDAFNTNAMAAVATHADDGGKTILDNGLITNHAYSVLGIDDLNKTDSDNNLSCRMINPWGEGIVWKGDDSVDGSSNATGEFWIAVQDMITNFHRLEICHKFDTSIWKHELVYGSWETGVNAGGDQYDAEFEKNPQLILQVAAAQVANSSPHATLLVELTQVGRRAAGLDNVNICLYVYELEESQGSEQLTNEFLQETKPLESARGQEKFPFKRRAIAERYPLPADTTLVIVPAIAEPGQEAKFMIRLICDAPITIKNFFNPGNNT